MALYLIWFQSCMHMLVALGTKDLGDISKQLLHAVRQSRYSPFSRIYLQSLRLSWKNLHHTITTSYHRQRPKMAHQSQPFNDLNNELRAIPPNADLNVAYIRMCYDWSDEEAIDPQYWQPHLLAFSGGDDYSVILEDVADYVDNRLARLEQTLCDRLDRENGCIVFHLTVQSSDKLKRHALRVDTSGTPRLGSIEDLYAGDGLRPELQLLLVRKQEKSRDIGSTHPRIKIRTRDSAVPFAEDDPALNLGLKYKFWDLSRFRPDIPTFPTSSKKTIEVTSRFIQHLEPSATAKFNFEQCDRMWDPQSISYATLRNAAIRELCRQSGSEAPFGDPYFIGDNCDLEFWVQPQGLNELFRLRPGEDVHRFLLQKKINRKGANLELYMETHVVPTGEMMNDVGNDQLHIRLTYDMEGIPELMTMHEQSQMLHFLRTHPFQDLVLDLAEFLTTYLATHEPEYYTSLEEEGSEHCLLLRPVSSMVVCCTASSLLAGAVQRVVPIQ